MQLVRLGLYLVLGFFVAILTDQISFKSKFEKFIFRVSVVGIVWVIDMLGHI